MQRWNTTMKASMVENENGQWVRYADVTALEAELARLKKPVSDEEYFPYRNLGITRIVLNNMIAERAGKG